MSESILKTATMSDLRAELEAREGKVAELKQRRDDLAAQVARIDQEIKDLKSPPMTAAPAPVKLVRRGRPPKAAAPAKPAAVAKPAPAAKPARAARAAGGSAGKETLADVMAKVMSKTKKMRADEIIAAVNRAGYKSTSKTFRTIVYQTLGRDKRFRRAGRGLYLLRGPLEPRPSL
jgi:hypothetical protein